MRTANLHCNWMDIIRVENNTEPYYLSDQVNWKESFCRRTIVEIIEGGRRNFIYVILKGENYFTLSTLCTVITQVRNASTKCYKYSHVGAYMFNIFSLLYNFNVGVINFR